VGGSNEIACYKLDVANNSIQEVSSLPQKDYFHSPSALIVDNELFAVGNRVKNIY